MIEITSIQLISEEKEIQFQITKTVKVGEDIYPLDITWCKLKNESIQISFSHPIGVSDFIVNQKDGLFYQVVKNLYQMLDFVEEANPQEKRGDKFYIATDDQQTGTADAVQLEKMDQSYRFIFNEFSAFQKGFTDITICKDSPTNRANYICMDQALTDLEKQYKASKPKKNILRRR